jgi:glutamate receptor, ionotropic, invertebrate
VIVERVLREDLKNGGLIVSYYSWTKINLRRDFSAVLSITNCDNTWEIYRDSRGENLLLMAITDPDCPRLPFEEAIMVRNESFLGMGRGLFVRKIYVPFCSLKI